jgi:ubiquinone/menaquinone biosynthesis C-methylase UbiE
MPRLSREFVIKLNWLLDEFTPPILRDQKWFSYIPMRIMFGSKAKIYEEFKPQGFKMSQREFSKAYEDTASVAEFQGETDLNKLSTAGILRNLKGQKILEVGAGRGYLSNLVSKKGLAVTACDIVIPEKLKERFPQITWKAANIQDLPFKDNSFDTVITTHTLEHVQDLQSAIAEVRRVAKKRLIVVVPRQRPAIYTFSLHLHFFPYEWSLPAAFGYRKGAKIQNLGDWLYIEDNPKP